MKYFDRFIRSVRPINTTISVIFLTANDADGTFTSETNNNPYGDKAPASRPEFLF